MKESDEQTSGTAQDGLINYMPGMPAVSSQPGRIERFLKRLGARRGKLRRVVQPRDNTVVQSRDETVVQTDD